jgi:phage repressor protein C with HTH and peptisase S24 domain
LIGSEKDADVARALGVASSSIPTWRKRGTVPYADLVHFAYRNEISLDELFYGGPMHHAEGEEAQPPHELSRAATGLLRDIDDALIDLADTATVEADHGGWAARLDEGLVGIVRDSAQALARLHSVANDDFVMVPRYDVHGSMGGGAIIHSEQVVDHLAFKADWVRQQLGARPADLVLISATGDSMEPTLGDGDLLLIDKSEHQFRDGAIYVLVVGDALLVKRIQHRLDQSIVIKSDNRAYESQALGPSEIESLQILGRVVWAGRRI